MLYIICAERASCMLGSFAPTFTFTPAPIPSPTPTFTFTPAPIPSPTPTSICAFSSAPIPAPNPTITTVGIEYSHNHIFFRTKYHRKCIQNFSLNLNT